MKKYSLYFFLIVIGAIAVLMIYIAVHFSTVKHQSDLLQFSIVHEVAFAQNINEALVLPIWQDQISKVAYLKKIVQIEEAVYIRILAQDGKILLSSLDGDEGKLMEEGILITKEPLVKEDFFQNQAVRLIIYPGHEDKTIVAAFPTIPNKVKAYTKDLWILDIIIAILATASFLLIVFLFLRILVQPLRKLAFAFEKVQQGNLDIQIDVKSKTEIGQLINAFNRMISVLHDYQKDIQEEHMALQEKVNARTEELRKLTQNLELQVQNKTQELRKKMRELEAFHKIAVERELKMIRLKKEILKLETRIKKQGPK